MDQKDEHVSIYLYQKLIVLFLLALMAVVTFVDFGMFAYEKDETMIRNMLIRFVGGSIMIYIMIVFGYKSLFKFKHFGKSLLIVIPALIIALNNFPIIAYIEGRAFLTEPLYRVYIFLIECFSVGFFEEIIFRGFLLIFLIKAFSHMKHGVLLSVFLSSLAFGLIHLLNIFSGASISNTLLQVGYSFLVGILWAVMYLKTGNLWVVMILHALYNFFGQVMFYLGVVNGRYDIFTIIITLGFAVLAALYTYRIYTQLPNHPLTNIFSSEPDNLNV